MQVGSDDLERFEVTYHHPLPAERVRIGRFCRPETGLRLPTPVRPSLRRPPPIPTGSGYDSGQPGGCTGIEANRCGGNLIQIMAFVPHCPSDAHHPPLALPAPNKKRKPSAVAAVPTTAPFDTAWFAGRINVAGEEELGSMLQVLDRKELEKEAELRMLEEDLVNAGDAEKRAELDREFDALCEREEAIMKELAAVRAAEE